MPRKQVVQRWPRGQVVSLGLLAATLACACGGSNPAPSAVDAGQDATAGGGAGGTQNGDALSPDLAADAGSTSDAGSAALPAECRVAASTRPQPYQLVFRLRNDGTTPIYLRQACVGVEFTISSCGSRYTDSVGPRYLCACLCSDSTCQGNVACGACPQPEGIAVAPGASKDVPWIASLALAEDRGSYQCANRPPLPAARYGLSVPLYATASEAAANANPVRVARRAFELPATGNLVELSLAAPNADGGAAPPAMCGTPAAQTPPVCAAPWDSAVACALDAAYTLARVGGLVAQQDDAVILPNGATTITRTYLATPQAPKTCTTQLPLCGAAPDRFTTAVFMEALTAPDVVAAFAAPPFVVYGEDARTYDGQVAQIKRGDGKGFMVGGPCRSGQPCGARLTAGLAHVAAVFDKIDRQLRADPACAALPP